MLPISSDDFTISFVVRILCTIGLTVYLIRATFFRIRGWRLQKRSRINGLRKIATEERLSRLLIKWPIGAVLFALLWLRLFVDDMDLRQVLGDGLITSIALCVVLLMACDDLYSRRMVAYDRAHPETRERQA